jgi:uncharacterized GH25 family protein
MLLTGATPADLPDDEGHFRLEGIGADVQWVVYGESDEYVSGESRPLKVAAGETKEIELRMQPGSSLRGRVVDENGRWLAGVRVQVGRLSDDLAKSPKLNAWEARSALGPQVYTTDEEGRFFASNLEPGLQVVRAAKDGYITWFKRDVTLGAGETHENYTIALSRGEVLAGTVFGADGRPLRRATVALTQTPDQNTGDDGSQDPQAKPADDVEPALFARTDEKGRFEIENIKPGRWALVVWFAPGHKGWMRDQSPAAIHRDLTIPGAPEQEFHLERADPTGQGLPFGQGGGRRGGRGGR